MAPAVTACPAPIVSAIALPSPQSTDLRIRIIYYGGEARRKLWFRATDAIYTKIPERARLKEDITRWARDQNLWREWHHARMFVMRGGSAGLVIDSEVGPVKSDDALRVMELYHGQPSERDVAEEELKDGLETSLAGGHGVLLTVRMDEFVEGEREVAGLEDGGTAEPDGHVQDGEAMPLSDAESPTLEDSDR